RQQPPRPQEKSGRRFLRVSSTWQSGIVRFVSTTVYSGKRAGVAELANALGLGPSGAEVPYRFKSCRPHRCDAEAPERMPSAERTGGRGLGEPGGSHSTNPHVNRRIWPTAWRRAASSNK